MTSGLSLPRSSTTLSRTDGFFHSLSYQSLFELLWPSGAPDASAPSVPLPTQVPKE